MDGLTMKAVHIPFSLVNLSIWITATTMTAQQTKCQAFIWQEHDCTTLKQGISLSSITDAVTAKQYDSC